MEFQLLATAKCKKRKRFSIPWQLSKISYFSTKYHVRTAKFIRVSITNAISIAWEPNFIANYLNRKYKDKHRMIGVYERRKPKLFILDPQLISEIYVKFFKYFMVNDSSDSVGKTYLLAQLGIAVLVYNFCC